MPVCELCGKNEFVKEDGLFVCQGCGTKYTPEEAKKLDADPGTAPDAAASAVGAVEGVAAVAIAMLVEALQNNGEFRPADAGADVQDVRSVNNYIAQGWQATVEGYERMEHPTKNQLDLVVARAKECLATLEQAALAEPDKYVQNTIIYNNCIAIEKSVRGLECYEHEDGEWKRVSFPVSSSDIKIAGQKGSWEDKRAVHEASIRGEYTDAHPEDAVERERLVSEQDKVQAQLDELKDEKKSKGLFNFADKKEVKERMAPVKEQLHEIQGQIRAIDARVDDYVDERIAELGTSFIQLGF